MIVGMRTVKQAARVAELTGGVHLPGLAETRWRTDVSRYVEVGPDFAAHRRAVESVSVLFDLFQL